MHIADGIFPPLVCVATDFAAAGMVWLSGRKTEPELIPRMGVFAAGLFVISLIHFPLGATSVHLGLYGVAGLIFGFRAIPIIFVDLLFQTLLFQHGGLLTLGINTLTMSSGALSAWAIWNSFPLNKQARAFLCGFLGVLTPALLISTLFMMVDYGKGILFIMSVYLLNGIIEGVLSLMIFNFLTKVKPGLIPLK